jgi:hypothetical protein
MHSSEKIVILSNNSTVVLKKVRPKKCPNESKPIKSI